MEGATHQHLCPLLPTLEPNPQWDSVRWWALWEAIGDREPSGVGSGAQGAPSRVRRVGTHKETGSPHLTPTRPPLTWTSRLQTARHRGCYGAPGLRSFVTAAQRTSALGPSVVPDGCGVRGASSDAAPKPCDAEAIRLGRPLLPGAGLGTWWPPGTLQELPAWPWRPRPEGPRQVPAATQRSAEGGR